MQSDVLLRRRCACACVFVVQVPGLEWFNLAIAGSIEVEEAKFRLIRAPRQAA